jgi:hypothetical protein
MLFSIHNPIQNLWIPARLASIWVALVVVVSAQKPISDGLTQ